MRGSFSGGTQLIHKERTKTDGSTDTLPLPPICVTALKIRRGQQQVARRIAGENRQKSDLVFTIRTGWPIEPRNINRVLDAWRAAAHVKVIKVHDARRTAVRYSSLRTFTPGWPCRSSGTAASPSRWRSTHRFPRVASSGVMYEEGSGPVFAIFIRRLGTATTAPLSLQYQAGAAAIEVPGSAREAGR
ncbi:hypothetical protein GCM10010439_41540 [Actinocorallia aurantiaca]|uniref:Uncharacterized protein n=1 Tax=Actinocorallia aurantiaca TaxID=46204 RepID=A0ABN3UBS9_9ACTN